MIRPRTLAWLGLAAIAVFSLAPGAFQLRTGASAEFEHFAAYLSAGSFLAMAYGRDFRVYVLVILALSGGAVLLELAQVWIPGRIAALPDVAASAFGAFFGVIAGAFLRQAAALLRAEPRRHTGRSRCLPKPVAGSDVPAGRTTPASPKVLSRSRGVSQCH